MGTAVAKTRLLLVGAAGSEFALAAAMARDAGAEVAMAGTATAALALLRNEGADLAMIDVSADVGGFTIQTLAPVEFVQLPGDPRKTPKGTLLQGTRTEGYWSSDPFSYGWRDSTDAQVEDALDELLKVLEPHRDFLSGISQEGAVRIWVSTHSNRNFALELPPNILGRLASLGITFVHDVYQGS